MKTIKTLRLKNFCSYDNTEIEFGPLTCFKGNNGHGKSNIILALVIVLFNLDFPADGKENCIRNGQKEASIEVEFTDGSSIYRHRTKTKQQIILRDSNGKKTEFNTAKCTEQVQDFTGFKQVQLDRNGSPQFLQYVTKDSPAFLFDKSPEVTYRMLSALISGQGIELVKAELQSEVRAIQADEKGLSASVDKYQTNVDYLTSKPIEALIERVEQTNTKAKQCDALEKELEEFLALLSFLNSSLSEDDEKYLTKLFASIEASLEDLAVIKAVDKAIDVLVELGNEYVSHEEEIERLNIALKKVQSEIKESTKYLQEFKCKQCGKLVKEICLNC